MRNLLLLLSLAATCATAQTAAVPTLYIAGDSTANNADRKGWGDPFSDHFDLTLIHVANRARAGRSARTFLTEGLWDGIAADLKPGDFVIIQFGHNDGSAPDKDRARGDLPGIGDEAKEFTMPNGKAEIVHTFGWYIRRFINDTKAKVATPIVLSLTVRNIWSEGKVERGSGNFGPWSAQVAHAEGVPFMDAAKIIADEYERMGEVQVKPLFPIDHTHTSQEGAKLVASLIAACLKSTDTPLASWLR